MKQVMRMCRFEEALTACCTMLTQSTHTCVVKEHCTVDTLSRKAQMFLMQKLSGEQHLTVSILSQIKKKRIKSDTSKLMRDAAFFSGLQVDCQVSIIALKAKHHFHYQRAKKTDERNLLNLTKAELFL